MAQDNDPVDRKPIPVTLLSGFLGSGKTTLLKHILTSSDHELRIAVIVNDVSSLNIDAALIKRHVVTQTEEKLIQLENGCICCTLRGDLLEELAKLAKAGNCDYIVIESTGISEPMQVAETFTEEFTKAMIEAAAEEGESLGEDNEKVLREIDQMGGLDKIATLDTLVTVVDAFNFFENFKTTEFITDRWGKENVDAEDERTITDLMVDQIEFSNTIIVNKIDSVKSKEKQRIFGVIKQLNPKAKIIESNYGKIDIKEAISTKAFNFEEAATGMGWLQSIHEMSKREVNGKIKISPKPETEEYGISNFVYRARRPFHPKRLYKLIYDKFVLMEGLLDDGPDEGEGEAGDDEDEEMEIDETTSSAESIQSGIDSSDESMEDVDDFEEDLVKSVDPKVAARNKQADPILRGLLRSKGFYWLATRPALHGDWSQAGTMLTLQGGGPWFCCTPAEEWPQDEPTKTSILADFEGEWEDRRQEIVFIGEKLDQRRLSNILDQCLLTDAEMGKWERIMRRKDDMSTKKEMLEQIFEDGFEDWPEPEDMQHDHGGHNGHHNH